MVWPATLNPGPRPEGLGVYTAELAAIMVALGICVMAGVRAHRREWAGASSGDHTWGMAPGKAERSGARSWAPALGGGPEPEDP